MLLTAARSGVQHARRLTPGCHGVAVPSWSKLNSHPCRSRVFISHPGLLCIHCTLQLLTFVAHAGAVARAVAPRGITDPSARTSHRRLMCFHFAPCRLVQRFHEPRACQYVIAVLAIPICASGVLCLCYGFRALSCCYLHCCAPKTATHAASLTSLTAGDNSHTAREILTTFNVPRVA